MRALLVFCVIFLACCMDYVYVCDVTLTMDSDFPLSEEAAKARASALAVGRGLTATGTIDPSSEVDWCTWTRSLRLCVLTCANIERDGALGTESASANAGGRGVACGNRGNAAVFCELGVEREGALIRRERHGGAGGRAGVGVLCVVRWRHGARATAAWAWFQVPKQRAPDPPLSSGADFACRRACAWPRGPGRGAPRGLCVSLSGPLGSGWGAGGHQTGANPPGACRPAGLSSGGGLRLESEPWAEPMRVPGSGYGGARRRGRMAHVRAQVCHYVNPEFWTRTGWWTLILLYNHVFSAVRC